MMRRGEQGFTFVELMIVMVIIGIMAALAIPNMSFMFEKDNLRTSTSSVTSSLYLARMKAVNDGEEYGVQFVDTGEFYVVRDPLGTPQTTGPPSRLEDGIGFSDVSFQDWLVVFTEQGQLEKTCLPSGDMSGTITLANDIGDSTRVEVTFITGRIRETNL